jgi:hypothetical protein
MCRKQTEVRMSLEAKGFQRSKGEHNFLLPL